MATALAEKNCTASRGGIPPLTSARRPKHFTPKRPTGHLLDDDKGIERTYRFRNFREAFNFVERAAALDEEEAHDPEIRFGWGFATVSLQTRKIKGRYENDFIMGPSWIAWGAVSCWTSILAHLGRLVSFVPEWSNSD